MTEYKQRTKWTEGTAIEIYTVFDDKFQCSEQIPANNCENFKPSSDHMRLTAPSWTHDNCRIKDDQKEWWKWIDQMCLNRDATEIPRDMLEPISRIEFADFEVAVPHKMKLSLQNEYGNNLNGPYEWDIKKQKYFKQQTDHDRHGFKHLFKVYDSYMASLPLLETDQMQQKILPRGPLVYGGREIENSPKEIVDGITYYDVTNARMKPTDLEKEWNTAIKLIFENGIISWVECGQQIGAFRYRNHVPWDHDLDIMIKRSDFKKAFQG